MDSREFGINRYPLLYLKEITNKDLLHGTGTLPNVMWGPGCQFSGALPLWSNFHIHT